MLNSNANLAQRLSTVEAINYAKRTNNLDSVKALETQLDELVMRAKKGY